MPTSNNTNAIQELFNLQISEANKLLDILTKEYDALRTNNNTQFITLVAEKQSSADKMSQLERQLFSTLSSQGFSGDKQGIDQLVTSARTKKLSKLVSTWDALQSIAKKCQQQNQINGRIINVAKVSTKIALDILNGHESKATTYDQNGKTDDDDDSQSLAIA